MKLIASTLALTLSAIVIGCAAAPPEEGAPSADTDALDFADEGSFHEGWSMNPVGVYNQGWGATEYWGVQYMRTSGSETRGGGPCIVYKKIASSCSSDAQCAAAAPLFGYCFAGECYTRPGSQPQACFVAQDRAPGFYVGQTDFPGGYLAGHEEVPYVLGCMTKAAGPSTACGGAPSGYMRWVNPMTVNEGVPFQP